MKILEEFAMLLADSTRSKAYLQIMIKEGFVPSLCIVFCESYETLKYNKKVNCINDDKSLFDEDEPIIETLIKNSVKYEIVEDKDINSDAMKNCLIKLPQKYIIYSGYGGAILKPHLFCMNKQFIHIHAGILPYYRGSTTAYYSILKENRIGATAIFMNAGIDEGKIIVKEDFELPHNETDLDYVFEPYVRAQVLIETIQLYIKNGDLFAEEQQDEKAETYFIIHPVLKHIAIMKMEGKKHEENIIYSASGSNRELP